MRNTLLFVAAAVLVAVTPTLLAADTIGNGGFETPVVMHDKGWNVHDSGTADWTVGWWGGSPTYQGVSRPSPAHLELHRGVNGWLSYQGAQHTELDSDWDGPAGNLTGEPASVSIYQDLATQNGQYVLRYAWSPRPNHPDNAMEVYWGGTLVAQHSAAGAAGTLWTFEELPLDAAAGVTQLEFREVGEPDSMGMFLDAVEVELVQVACTQESVPLCAGQTMDIGTVTVTNDDANLYVTFEITDEGWYLQETHVAVASTVDGLPQTRKGNPIPGRFPYSCDLTEMETSCTVTVPLDGWCAGDLLAVAAHAAVGRVAGDGCTETVFWATEAIDWDQGTLGNGGEIAAYRSDPTNALGAPDGLIFSLGYDLVDDGYSDGWLVVGFGGTVYDGPGADLIIQELTYGRDSFPEETAKIFGMLDDTSYYAGEVTNHDNGTGLGEVSLPDGVDHVDVMMAMDATDLAIHRAYTDAYDVDAIGACYMLEGEETAWGDGCTGTEFSNRRGWATYFEYTVNDCASCVQ